MVKLSKQILSTQETPRATRTQRVMEREKEERKEKEFRTLQEKAKRLRETEFKEVNSIEEYERKYNLLDSDVKPFFTKPSTLKEQQKQEITTTTQRVKDRIEYAKKRKQQEYEDYQQDLRNYQKYKERAKTNREKENYEEREDKRVDEWEEERTYWENYLKGLNEGYNRLSKGENLNYQDVEGYAQDLGNEERQVKELRNRQRIESKKSYERLLETSSYSPFFKEVEKKYSSKIDWTNPKNVSLVLQSARQRTTTQEGLTKEQKEELDRQYKQVINERVGYIDWYSDNGNLYPISPTGTPKKQDNVFKRIANFYQKIPEFPFYINVDKTQGVSLSTFGVSLYKTKGSISLPEIKGELLKTIDEKSIKTFEKEITRRGIKEDLDKKFQQEYETRFYRSEEGRKAFYGEVDFEEAVKKFDESETAKLISQKYQREVQEKRKGKFTREGFKLAGLGLARTGVTLVPTTVKGAVAEGVILYSGYKVLKVIPPTVSNVGTGVIGTLGTFQAISPTGTPESKAGGVITAGVSFGILGYQGVKYLRKPIVRTKPISIKPKLSKQLQRGIVTKKGTLVVTDIKGKKTVLDLYKTRKLTEQITYGRRTIVTTKWRDLIGYKPVYSGIPYQQKGTTYILKGLRGDFVFTTKSGYQKALDLLVKRGGYTVPQAKETLRYYSPKRVFSSYKADVIVRYGDLYKKPLISIRGTKTITKPVNVIDKQLGIKTRGGTQVKEFIKGEGRIVGTYKGDIVYKTNFDIEKTLISKSGGIYQRLSDVGKTTKSFEQLTRVTDKGSEILKVKLTKTSPSLIKEYPTQIFQERSFLKPTVPKGKIVYGEGESLFIKNKNVPKIEVDLREIYKIGIKEDIIKQISKPPVDVSRLKDVKYAKEVIKTLKNIYGTKPTIKPISKPVPVKTSTIQIKETKTLSLKSTLNPVDIVKQSIKELPKVAGSSKSISSLLSSATLSRSSTKLKTSLSPKQREVDLLKDIIKEGEIETTAEASSLDLGTSTLFRQIQTPKSQFDFLPPPVIISPTIPSFPKIKPPTTQIPVIPFFLPSTERGGKKRSKSKGYQELTYLPDFTARSLGLTPEIVSEKQAKKRLKQILTGLEIRKPVKLKI